MHVFQPFQNTITILAFTISLRSDITICPKAEKKLKSVLTFRYKTFICKLMSYNAIKYNLLCLPTFYFRVWSGTLRYAVYQNKDLSVLHILSKESNQTLFIQWCARLNNFFFFLFLNILFVNKQVLKDFSLM